MYKTIFFRENEEFKTVFPAFTSFSNKYFILRWFQLTIHNKNDDKIPTNNLQKRMAHIVFVKVDTMQLM